MAFDPDSYLAEKGDFDPDAYLGIAKAAAKPAKPGLSWSDVPAQAAINFLPSVGNIAKGIYDTVTSPRETALNLLDIGAGAVQNILPKGVVDWVNTTFPSASADEARAKADAVGRFYVDRYGSEEGFKKALAKDPAGVLADASTILTAGGGIAAKAGQLAHIPKLEIAGRAITQAGVAVDPIMNSVKAANLAGRGVANVIGGIGTHTGGSSIQNAFKAGAVGGDAAAEFRANLRGNVPMTSVLDEARAALSQIYKDRSAAYQSGMAKIAQDKKTLSFGGIDSAVADAMKMGKYKDVITNAKTVEVSKEIYDIVADFKSRNPIMYHTPEGFDALKRSISAVVEKLPYEEKTARLAAGNVAKAVKSEIVKQAKSYADTMADYERASDLVKEIERSLVGGRNTSTDAAMRKLQSLTRNNVSTNYGNRVELAKELEKAGAGNLMTNLSGQALNTWTPRGLGGLVSGGTAFGGLYTSNPWAIPLLAAQSPRIVGELAHGAGRVKGMLSAPVTGFNLLAEGMGANPAILANYLYQADQPKE